jgi:hypothetical protein
MQKWMAFAWLRIRVGTGFLNTKIKCEVQKGSEMNKVCVS